MYTTQGVSCNTVSVSPPPVTCWEPTPHFSSGCALLLSLGDANRDGVITEAEIYDVEEPFHGGEFTEEEFEFIIDAYNAGSINNLCPGCFVGEANIAASQITVTPSSCASPCGVTITIEWSNTGYASGEIYPGYTLQIGSNTPVEYVSSSPISIGANSTQSWTVVHSDLPEGTHIICPLPN